MSDRMDEIRDDRAAAEPTRAELADPPPDSEDERELITKLVTGADTALLTSRGTDGTLHARPLAVLQREFDGVVRFL
ncbi:MAG TPA: hypothetical protein VFS72_00620, partial [Agromyces sp.]|nr:hypothetical protein [Agromyces sp.]